MVAKETGLLYSSTTFPLMIILLEMVVTVSIKEGDFTGLQMATFPINTLVSLFWAGMAYVMSPTTLLSCASLLSNKNNNGIVKAIHQLFFFLIFVSTNGRSNCCASKRPHNFPD